MRQLNIEDLASAAREVVKWFVIFVQFFSKKAEKSFADSESAITFALPIKNWIQAYVSENQNKITVLRSQPGG